MWKCLQACFYLVFASILFCSCYRNNSDYTIIDKKCGTCHNASIVYRKKLNDYEWDRILYAMKQRGLKLTDREEQLITEILHNKF
jgi:hypothetical protein